MPKRLTPYEKVENFITKCHDDKVKIFLLGNTVNKHNLYFKEFGLTRTKFQQPDTIAIINEMLHGGE